MIAGEATVRPDLGALLAVVMRSGAQAGIATSGRALVYAAVRARLLRGHVSYVRVPMYGPDASTHDKLSGIAGSFEQTTAGALALLAEASRPLFVDFACTVTRANEDALDSLVETWARLAPSSSVGLRFVAPAAGLNEAEWPSAAAPQRVAKAIDRALELAPQAELAWEGFPPCMLGGHEGLRDEDLRSSAPTYGPEDGGGSLVQVHSAAHAKPYPCQECIHESGCPGIDSALLSRWGEKALMPTRGVRANSFNFERAENLGALVPAASSCPIRTRTRGADHVRDLVLLGEDGATLYRSPTRDFTDEEIRRTKNELEQIYLDASNTAVLTGFTSGVRRVRPHTVCVDCAARGECPRTWVEDPEPPFAREECWLRSEVSAMCGRVLDVGCGEQPYRDEIAAGISAGRIDYLGLDPDVAAIERFRAAVPGSKLVVGGIEEFDRPAGFYDCVLIVRSFNHFRDLERSFAVIERLLRPGGSLYVADSVVFGMLRRHDQVSYADEHAPIGHEHFRNWSSVQLLDFLARYQFDVDVHRSVSASTSAQWMVKLSRTARDALSPQKGTLP